MQSAIEEVMELPAINAYWEPLVFDLPPLPPVSTLRVEKNETAVQARNITKPATIKIIPTGRPLLLILFFPRFSRG